MRKDGNETWCESNMLGCGTYAAPRTVFSTEAHLSKVCCGHSFSDPSGHVLEDHGCMRQETVLC